MGRNRPWQNVHFDGKIGRCIIHKMSKLNFTKTGKLQKQKGFFRDKHEQLLLCNERE